MNLIPADNSHLLNIGIAPETMGAVATPQASKPKLIVVGGDGPGPIEVPRLVDVTGGELTSLTWPKYLEWRKTKCRPYDYEVGPVRATTDIPAGPPPSEDLSRERCLEEIDQATHEFVGEVAELGELFLTHGPSAFFGDARTKLIDECGDILFCGAWCFDAWGHNPLAHSEDDLELMRVTDEHECAQLAGVLANVPAQRVLGNDRFCNALAVLVFRLMLAAQTCAGLLCNSFKKLRYHRRAQDVEVQIGRIAQALFAVNQILILANSSVEEALTVNMRKLDSRYPDGYVPGQGGGIRTGGGK